MKNLINIKVTGAAITGRSHLSKGTPCQDYVSHKRFNKTEACIALADGAGSCSMSHFGAQEATQSIIRLFSCKAFRYEIGKMEDGDLQAVIIDHVINDMSSLASRLSCSLRDLSCTLMFVYVRITCGKSQYIVGHIGDGAVFKYKQGVSSVFSSPESGEFVNETYFVTHPKAKEMIKIQKGTESTSIGFLLMSDGTEHSLLNRKTCEVGNASNVLFKWAYGLPTYRLQNTLIKNLEEVFKLNTTDDCSIGLIYCSTGV